MRKKNDFRIKSGTLGVRQTKKSYFCTCHSQSSELHIRKFCFLFAQLTLLKSRDYLKFFLILENGKKLLENKHEKAVPYLKNGLHLVKDKLSARLCIIVSCS